MTKRLRRAARFRRQNLLRLLLLSGPGPTLSALPLGAPFSPAELLPLPAPLSPPPLLASRLALPLRRWPSQSPAASRLSAVSGAEAEALPLLRAPVASWARGV